MYILVKSKLELLKVYMPTNVDFILIRDMYITCIYLKKMKNKKKDRHSYIQAYINKQNIVNLHKSINTYMYSSK